MTALVTGYNEERNDATNELNNPLWEYALSIYSPLEVELLDCQDQGHRVTHILLALWLASINRRLTTPPDTKWQSEVIEPLRAIRINMKRNGLAELFREKVKALELMAEQWELSDLYSEYKNEDLADEVMTGTSIAQRGLQNLLALSLPPEAAERIVEVWLSKQIG